MRTSTTSRSRSCRSLLAGGLAVALAACSGGEIGGPGTDPSLEGISLSDVQPRTLVLGSTLVVEGSSFVGPPWGVPRMRFQGTFAGASLDKALSLRFVDYDRLEIFVDPLFTSTIGGEEGDFVGEVVVEIDSAEDGKTYATEPLAVTLQLRRQLTPRLDVVQTGGVIFVNDRISVQGDGLLLGGDEGTTYAVVDGCFTPDGDTGCAPISRTDVPVVPESAYDRTRGTFMFSPSIAGISPGHFVGTVELRNDHSLGDAVSSDSRSADYDLIEASVFSISPTAASLGQYVTISGGGFVGGDDGGDTLVQMRGNFVFDSGPTVPVDLLLVPEFVDGNTVRYVLNEDDSLGQALDLRTDTGQFSGTVAPVVSYGGDEVTGDSASFSLRVAPIKQVVYFKFLPSYVESLRAFGLRAVDAQVRQRVMAVTERAYAGVNIEVRLTPPTDFALYAQVEIAGPDPNGLGLLGYDNTPGKDNGNQRLYDRMGGVNALTQEDGYPGYGGVFIESLFGFSEHPGEFAERLPAATATFDEVFDPFRPDRGGKPVAAADLAGGSLPTTDGSSCPAEGERAMQVACAIHVVGSLIGTTAAHELGHSLGLANPYGEGFHNIGDAPRRLMDAGASRSFTERAELFGDGPAVFCDEEFAYLRQILPSSEPADSTARPGCF